MTGEDLLFEKRQRASALRSWLTYLPWLPLPLLLAFSAKPIAIFPSRGKPWLNVRTSSYEEFSVPVEDVILSTTERELTHPPRPRPQAHCLVQ